MNEMTSWEIVIRVLITWILTITPMTALSVDFASAGPKDQSSAEFDVLEKINDDEIGEAPMISSRDMTAILGGVICFWGGVWALGAVFMVVLMAKNYCIKSAEAGSEID